MIASQGRRRGLARWLHSSRRIAKCDAACCPVRVPSKIPLAPSGKSILEARPSLCPIKRGVSRSSRTLGEGCDGRVGVARRAVQTRTAKSCGLDTSTLVSTRDNALHCAGMVTRKPDHQREPEVSRKTIAQGMPGVSGEPVVTTLVCFFRLHARLRVHGAPGISCALLIREAAICGAKLARMTRRDRRGVTS